jgi:hypothetical protein
MHEGIVQAVKWDNIGFFRKGNIGNLYILMKARTFSRAIWENLPVLSSRMSLGPGKQQDTSR